MLCTKVTAHAWNVHYFKRKSITIRSVPAIRQPAEDGPKPKLLAVVMLF